MILIRVGALALGQVLPAALIVLCLLVLNARFYALLLRRRGPLQAAAGVVLHVVHHLVGVASLPWGLLVYAREQHGLRESARAA